MAKSKQPTKTEIAKAEEAAEAAKVASTEAQLVAKYGDKIVKGSVHRAPKGSKYGDKMLCEINTVGVDGTFDGKTRTVATSDVFQVHHTEEVAAELRKIRAKEKRAAARAAKAETAEPKAKTKAEKLEALGL